MFLTRQTTSPILLRQMVGRALRGPKFGGTAKANIVLFMDAWREAIQWADFDGQWGEEAAETRTERRPSLPLQMISIELIRQLAREMESGQLAPASFLELLPLGWYVPEFDVVVAGSEDTEHVRPMVLVYQDEREAYDAFLRQVAQQDLRLFADPGLRYETVEAQILAWRDEAFKDEGHRSTGLTMNLFQLARHLAQSGGQRPPFFPFEVREEHDLTSLAEVAAAEDWGPRQTVKELEGVYLDERRFWRAMIPTFDLFRQQFGHLVDGVIERTTGVGAPAPSAIMDVIAPAPALDEPEAPQDVKHQVIRRDQRCLCCGNTRRLEVDHLTSRFHGGTHDPANLQTLCSICNRDKSIREMHFRKTGTLLRSAPPMRFPSGFSGADLDHLKQDIQRAINMYYQCAAVDEIETARRGIKRYEWRIKLRSGNPVEWFGKHLPELFERVRAAQAGDRSGPVRSIVLEGNGADGPQLAFREFSHELGAVDALAESEIRPAERSPCTGQRRRVCRTDRWRPRWCGSTPRSGALMSGRRSAAVTLRSRECPSRRSMIGASSTGTWAEPPDLRLKET